jgi:2-hydroxy-3-keto-5-methylthiopentenyl-1-phosphate phosphatase
MDRRLPIMKSKKIKEDEGFRKFKKWIKIIIISFVIFNGLKYGFLAAFKDDNNNNIHYDSIEEIYDEPILFLNKEISIEGTYKIISESEVRLEDYYNNYVWLSKSCYEQRRLIKNYIYSFTGVFRRESNERYALICE